MHYYTSNETIISKYKLDFFPELGSLKPNTMAEALVETTSDLANMVKGSPSQYVKVALGQSYRTH